MKNFSDRSFKENQNTRFMFSMRKNMVEADNPQMTVYGAEKMPFTFRVTRASTCIHIICIRYLPFSAARKLTLTHLNITLNVQCLSYYEIQVNVSKLYRY